jgi:hypothetical protein
VVSRAILSYPLLPPSPFFPQILFSLLMADVTRLAQLTNSLKTCHDHIAQQESTNIVVQQQLTELTEMFQTFVAAQPRPPPERPPPDEPPLYHLPFASSRNDH